MTESAHLRSVERQLVNMVQNASAAAQWWDGASAVRNYYRNIHISRTVAKGFTKQIPIEPLLKRRMYAAQTDYIIGELFRLAPASIKSFGRLLMPSEFLLRQRFPHQRVFRSVDVFISFVTCTAGRPLNPSEIELLISACIGHAGGAGNATRNHQVTTGAALTF